MKNAKKLIMKNIDNCINSNGFAVSAMLALTSSIIVGICYLYTVWYDWIVQSIWHKDINNLWFLLLAMSLGYFELATLIPTIITLYILIFL